MTAAGAAATRPARAPAPRLNIGDVFTLGHLSEGHVLALAAAAAPSRSADPVDIALAETVATQFPDLLVVPADESEVDPATRGRRFSLTLVQGFAVSDGAEADLVVMRGAVEAVLAQVEISRKDRGQVRRNAAWAGRHGWRPLAVAIAPLGPGGQVGPFAFQGFVDVGFGKPRSTPDYQSASWVRVNVWSASLRLQHWINVALVFTLSCTGYLIMDPFFGPSVRAGTETGFQMGWVRLIHFGAAFVWLVVGATRVVSAFTSRDLHLRWTEWWPLKRKQDFKNLGEVLQHYALIKVESPLFVAHNPLQHLTYAAVYVACGIQMITGFALFGLYQQTSAFWRLVATPVHWFGIPGIRVFHTMMMFALWAFVIAHVYLAVRADSLERHGGISSMINGGVWLKRGAKPVDAPEIG
jgi:Ni/Fe-hydrogenase b-type cytochrome subunit